MSEEVAEELPAALRGALAADGGALLEELQLLGQMPQVRLVPSSIFDRAKPAGSNAQLRGVVIKLRCCKKSLDAKCNDMEGEQACPDELDPNAQPAFMIVNSSEVRGVATLGRGPKAELQEILPAPLKGVPMVNTVGSLVVLARGVHQQLRW